MTRPLCRYCGKPIAKKTHTVYFSPGNSTDYWTHIDAKPHTKAEAKRLVNEEIISVHKHHADPNRIASVNTWDGESYVDKYFCTGTCAKGFAYMIAKAKPGLGSQSWADALRKRGESGQ